nr:TNT domain-containing protein [Chromobacterium haemolyticum]
MDGGITRRVVAGVVPSKGIIEAESLVYKEFSENSVNRTYRSLNLTINERALLTRERGLAEAAGWKRPDGSIWWPPYDGALPGTQRFISLESSGGGGVNLVDRFGRTTGSFVSPAGLPLESHALSSMPSFPPSVYSVNGSILGVERATIAPWFGQKGLGVQYKLPNSVQYYLDIEKLGGPR